MKKRVVVTGMGVVSLIGTSVEEFWRNNQQGISGVRHVTKFPIPEDFSQIAGMVDGFTPEKYDLDPTMDRSCQFAVKAATEAIKQAQLKNYNPSRCAVYISSAIGNIVSMEQNFEGLTQAGTQEIPPFSMGSPVYEWFQFQTASRILAQKFNFTGGYNVITTGCTGGLDAVGYALQAIQTDWADVVITGATEAPITPLVVASFGKINATSKRNDDPQGASRPFDVDRNGFVLGEGCGILVLESLEHARNRGAKILAEVLGYGSCNNAEHMSDIAEDGIPIAESIQLALEDAEIDQEEIDFVNLHGSSTPQNDRAESNALHRIFGKRTRNIPVTSVKSQIGHPLSASNSIELISTIQTLQTQIIPPTINVKQQDPKCDLNVITGSNYQASVQTALKVSSGFSGIHSSLVLRTYEE